MLEKLENCTLCPRNCKVNRTLNEKGFCQSGDKIKVSRAALHFFEEPCISNKKGSGAIFFSGCNLRCVFCQNDLISSKNFGVEITVDRLVEIYFELREKGACNINLVTPSHFVSLIAVSLQKAKEKGFDLPIIYNTSSYENVETLKLLDGLIDVYLPDLKYYDDVYGEKYSNAKEYFSVASKAIAEMYRQVGENQFNKDGMIEKGVIVRHLVMPGLVENSKKVIHYLYKTYQNSIYLSIMNQFTPNSNLEKYPEINRAITEEEYESVLQYAILIGVENAFIQEGGTVSESFIPEFNLEGVIK